MADAVERDEGVSVVIPHFGDPALALALVADLAEQRSRRPLEVCVVDDCSPVAFPPTPGVVVVRREANGGFGAAVNTGVAATLQPYVLVLNSDLRVPDGWLEGFLDLALPQMPAVVAPTVVCGGRETGGFRFPRARFQAVEWVSVLGRWQDTDWFHHAVGKIAGPGPGRRRDVDWVSGEAMFFARSSLEQVSGFDESYFMYAEEVDLQLRLRRQGVRALLVGTRPVLHAGAASTDPARARAWLVESRLHYAAKWGQLRRLRAALTVATGANLLVNTARWTAGRPVDPFGTARAEMALVWRRSTVGQRRGT